MELPHLLGPRWRHIGRTKTVSGWDWGNPQESESETDSLRRIDSTGPHRQHRQMGAPAVRTGAGGGGRKGTMRGFVGGFGMNPDTNGPLAFGAWGCRGSCRQKCFITTDRGESVRTGACLREGFDWSPMGPPNGRRHRQRGFGSCSMSTTCPRTLSFRLEAWYSVARYVVKRDLI